MFLAATALRRTRATHWTRVPTLEQGRSGLAGGTVLVAPRREEARLEPQAAAEHRRPDVKVRIAAAVGARSMAEAQWVAEAQSMAEGQPTAQARSTAEARVPAEPKAAAGA